MSVIDGPAPVSTARVPQREAVKATDRITAHAASRYPELDGMRGFAALAVAVSHLLGAIAPTLWDGRPAAESPLGYATERESTFAALPIRVLWEGNFAVLFFFVHSGFVLSVHVLRNRADTFIVEQQAVRRFVRIGVPVYAAIVVIFAMSRLGVYSDVVWNGQTVMPTLANLQTTLTGGVLLRGEDFYSTPLWSMSVEIFMSFAVFAFVAMYRNAKYLPLWLIFWAWVGWTMGAVYGVAFALGVLIADRVSVGQRTDGTPFRSESQRRWLAPMCLVAALLLGSYPPRPSMQTWHVRYIDPLIERLSPETTYSFRRILVQSIAGALLLVAVMSMPKVKRALCTRPLVHLGRLSFPVYLVHMPVIAVILGPLYSLIDEHHGRLPAVLTVLGVAPVAWIAVAEVFSRAFDQPAIRLGRRLSQVGLRRRDRPAIEIQIRHSRRRWSIPTTALGVTVVLAAIAAFAPDRRVAFPGDAGAGSLRDRISRCDGNMVLDGPGRRVDVTSGAIELPTTCRSLTLRGFEIMVASEEGGRSDSLLVVGEDQHLTLDRVWVTGLAVSAVTAQQSTGVTIIDSDLSGSGSARFNGAVLRLDDAGEVRVIRSVIAGQQPVRDAIRAAGATSVHVDSDSTVTSATSATSTTSSGGDQAIGEPSSASRAALVRARADAGE